jgi:hypothetical protein
MRAFSARMVIRLATGKPAAIANPTAKITARFGSR